MLAHQEYEEHVTFMKAVQLHEYGDPEKLKYEEIPTPEPKPGEVLVRVIATSINPVDWKIRSGAAKDRMPVQCPYIPGRDVSGEVVKTGAGVSSLEPGQRVMGLVQHSYAEFLVAPADNLTIIPEGLDLELAGALPLVLTTGAQLVEHIHPKAGQTVLVTGALGSVGRTAVFVVKQSGARVIAGVRGSQKADAGALGADQVVAIDDDGEIQSLPQLDAIADTVDHDVIGKLIPKIKEGGILGSVLGKPKEAEGKKIYVEAFMAQPDADRLEQLARAIQRKEFSIPLAKKFTLSEAGAAQKLAESGGVNGKILLLP
ncbi:MAG: NADP-dependent oxidoreductase [Acidobacteriota bacterium]|nr:NADP-dependent oxidoreductase [Acidobacteriota bacterium]